MVICQIKAWTHEKKTVLSENLSWSWAFRINEHVSILKCCMLAFFELIQAVAVRYDIAHAYTARDTFQYWTAHMICASYRVWVLEHLTSANVHILAYVTLSSAVDSILVSAHRWHWYDKVFNLIKLYYCTRVWHHDLRSFALSAVMKPKQNNTRAGV